MISYMVNFDRLVVLIDPLMTLISVCEIYSKRDKDS